MLKDENMINTSDVVGKNLYEYRTKLNYTQEQVAKCLDTDRTMISKFENNTRELSLLQLTKLATLFGIELEDFFELNSASKIAGMAFAYRADGLSEEDILGIMAFKKIVKNYLKMKEIMDETV